MDHGFRCVCSLFDCDNAFVVRAVSMTNHQLILVMCVRMGLDSVSNLVIKNVNVALDINDCIGLLSSSSSSSSLTLPVANSIHTSNNKIASKDTTANAPMDYHHADNVENVQFPNKIMNNTHDKGTIINSITYAWQVVMIKIKCKLHLLTKNNAIVNKCMVILVHATNYHHVNVIQMFVWCSLLNLMIMLLKCGMLIIIAFIAHYQCCKKKNQRQKQQSLV